MSQGVSGGLIWRAVWRVPGRPIPGNTGESGDRASDWRSEGWSVLRRLRGDHDERTLPQVWRRSQLVLGEALPAGLHRGFTPSSTPGGSGEEANAKTPDLRVDIGDSPRAGTPFWRASSLRETSRLTSKTGPRSPVATIPAQPEFRTRLATPSQQAVSVACAGPSSEMAALLKEGLTRDKLST